MGLSGAFALATQRAGHQSFQIEQAQIVNVAARRIEKMQWPALCAIHKEFRKPPFHDVVLLGQV